MSFLAFIFAIGLIGGYVYLDRKQFEKSAYKRESGNGYLVTRFNKGNYGEYLSFNKLETIKGHHKTLTNVYIPKGDGKTTEIDLVYIHETGIYVIESKNYSGWIFGNETSKFWTQTFKTGQKERFYNPILQNNTHIKYLSKVLNLQIPNVLKSIIVFSERCTLKKVEVHSETVKVVNRYDLIKAIHTFINNSHGVVFTESQIEEMYTSLKQYTNVSEEIKTKHIRNIQDLKDVKY
jgi:uncharacterized protein YneF (UPF0154 family)